MDHTKQTSHQASHTHSPSSPSPPPLCFLQLPPPVLQHIATLCPTHDLGSLRATCSALRDLQPNGIRLACRLHWEGPLMLCQARLQPKWHQDLSLSRALAAKWPGASSATIDMAVNVTLNDHLMGHVLDTDLRTICRVLDEVGAQLAHWQQLREVTIRGLPSDKLVAAVVAACSSLTALRLEAHTYSPLQLRAQAEADHARHGHANTNSGVGHQEAAPRPAAPHPLQHPAHAGTERVGIGQLHRSLQHLTRCSSLRKLELPVVHAGGWHPCCEAALCQLTQLQELVLCAPEESLLDAAALSSTLSRLPGLTRLYVSCWEATGEWEIGPMPKLQTLELVQHPEPNSAAPLSTIRDCPHLTRICLSCVPFSPKVADPLPSLQRLEVGAGDVGPAGVAWMAACCPHLTSLRARELRLDNIVWVEDLLVGGCLLQLKDLRVEKLYIG